ncbi:helix-turn-helix domain-containing protein [Roseomonas sp. AR75]|uniref:helix-turn-helix domain-containing protein n=1 Tax=Roseomonas sp. AR75 TaxID=2562311 RepID=UPI0014853C3E|nr:helix-turn-helix domain-containing protein [Roseomonas sp. AR75]
MSSPRLDDTAERVRLGNAGDVLPAARRAPLAFSTLDLPPAEQFAAWHESSAGTVDTAPLRDAAAGFPARREVWRFGPLALATMQAPAARLSRSLAQSRRNGLDHWMISVARRGERRIRSGDTCLMLSAGAVSVGSLDDVFVSDRSDIDWLCLFVPREVLPELGAALHASRDAPLDSAMGRLLAAYILQLAAEMPALGAAELPRVVESTRAMIAASIAPGAGTMAAARAPLEQVLISRIKALIRQHLRSAMLGPDRLAKLAGVSRSQLYRLFEPQGGVAHYIQTERLRAAARALGDAADTREIASIAEDVGFFDHSSFSRIFRREFGCSPREFRIAALAGQAFAPSRGAAEMRPRDHAELLRRL